MDGGTGSPHGSASAPSADVASGSPASVAPAEMAEMYGNLHEWLGGCSDFMLLFFLSEFFGS